MKKEASAIRLEPFTKVHYADLEQWVDSEEMAMQFAGISLTYPLTTEKLEQSQHDINRKAFIVISNDSNRAVGHGEVYLLEHTAKLGRILIGDQSQRGKGIGEQLVRLLLEYVFSNTNKLIAELYVFDWNIGAIKCYEKVGFLLNPEKKVEREIKGQVWTAVNMTINKSAYNC